MPPLTRTPKRRVESTVLGEILRWAGQQPDVTLFRNNVGKLQDATGRWVTYGLCVGSADLIGWLKCHVHPIPFRGIPCEVARFVAIECKMPGKKPTADQAAWLALARAQGCVAGVVTSVAEAEALLVDAKGWL